MKKFKLEVKTGEKVNFVHDLDPNLISILTEDELDYYKKTGCKTTGPTTNEPINVHPCDFYVGALSKTYRVYSYPGSIGCVVICDHTKAFGIGYVMNENSIESLERMLDNLRKHDQTLDHDHSNRSFFTHNYTAHLVGVGKQAIDLRFMSIKKQIKKSIRAYFPSVKIIHTQDERGFLSVNDGDVEKGNHYSSNMPKPFFDKNQYHPSLRDDRPAGQQYIEANVKTHQSSYSGTVKSKKTSNKGITPTVTSGHIMKVGLENKTPMVYQEFMEAKKKIDDAMMEVFVSSNHHPQIAWLGVSDTPHTDNYTFTLVDKMPLFNADYDGSELNVHVPQFCMGLASTGDRQAGRLVGTGDHDIVTSTVEHVKHTSLGKKYHQRSKKKLTNKRKPRYPAPKHKRYRYGGGRKGKKNYR